MSTQEFRAQVREQRALAVLADMMLQAERERKTREPQNRFFTYRAPWRKTMFREA